MQAHVYASRRQAGTYVWLCRRDDFDSLPDTLRERLGELRFVLELDLTAERRLPNADAAAVLARLEDQSWYLQLPPPETITRAGSDEDDSTSHQKVPGESPTTPSTHR